MDKQTKRYLLLRGMASELRIPDRLTVGCPLGLLEQLISEKLEPTKAHKARPITDWVPDRTCGFLSTLPEMDVETRKVLIRMNHHQDLQNRVTNDLKKSDVQEHHKVHGLLQLGLLGAALENDLPRMMRITNQAKA